MLHGFGDRLGQAMESQEMSRADLATKMGVSVVAVHGWLNGAIPRHDRWETLAKAVKSSVSWLFFGERKKAAA